MREKEGNEIKEERLDLVFVEGKEKQELEK